MNLFFVASDQLSLLKSLEKNSKLIQIIKEFKSRNLKKIIAIENGTVRLIFSAGFKKEDLDIILSEVELLKLQLDAIETLTSENDFFSNKRRTFQAIAFGFAIYGISSFFAIFFFQPSIYLDLWRVIGQGLIFISVVFAITIFVTLITFRKSSRSIDVIGELLIWASLAYPCGPQILMTINELSDRSEPTISQASLISASPSVVGSVKKALVFNADFLFQNNPAQIPNRLRIPFFTYQKLKGQSKVEFFVKAGALKYSYIEKIRLM